MTASTADLAGTDAPRQAPPRERPPGTAVAVEALGLRYGPVYALEDVSLTVRAGEILCVLGASGSGKSTLLWLLAGVARPTTGRILIGGEEAAGPSVFVEPERRRVGLVFQDYALFPHLTVAANVGFGLHGRPRQETEAVVAAMLARVDLTRYARSYPHKLSGGERQRVAVARALAPRPRVLLMDEPFSSLDGPLREHVREQTIGLLREDGTTAIVVTHEPDEAVRIADRIALLDRGRLVECGSAETLYAQPATALAARLFGHSNELGAICRNARLDTPLGTFDAPHLAEDARGSVFIRPHHLTVTRQPPGVCGRVVRTMFLGHAEHVLVAVPGLDTPVTVRADGLPRLEPGEAVYLGIHRDGVHVVGHDTTALPDSLER